MEKSLKEKMDSKSEEIYYLLYRLFELNLIQTNDYDEDRFDEITDDIEKNGVDKSYKNEAYKLAMQYINHDFSNGKEYKEIVKKFLDLFGLQVNTHSVEWNIISESKKSARKSLMEKETSMDDPMFWINHIGDTALMEDEHSKWYVKDVKINKSHKFLSEVIFVDLKDNKEFSVSISENILVLKWI